VLDKERLHMLRTDPDAYQHVWEGDVLRISDAVIFKNKFEVVSFDTPANVRFFHGVDWGFAKDPTCLIRCFVLGNFLYIDREAWGVGVDLDSTPALFNTIETSPRWPIKADSARPETIHYMSIRGYNISGAKKWNGSVEDGIAFLRSFDRIYIHQRCKHTAENFRLYSYKTDRDNGDVLPIVVDKHDHAPDAVRYAFDGLIRARGEIRVGTRKPMGL
jgi:phage terminase large subunit